MIFFSLIQGIKNLIKWFPIIWRDRDWDFEYLLVLMRKKLSSMEKSFALDKEYFEDAEDVIKEIKVCRILLDRILEDDCTNPASTEQDYDYLFRFLKKHMRTWWD